MPPFGDYVCSKDNNGITKCSDIPSIISNNNSSCLSNNNYTINNFEIDSILNDSLCIDWNKYYTKCDTSKQNPLRGAISFDNIAYAWIAIFQVIIYIPGRKALFIQYIGVPKGLFTCGTS